MPHCQKHRGITRPNFHLHLTNLSIHQLRGSYTPISLLATFATPITQPGTLNPKMDFSKTVGLARTGQAGPFTLYSGVATLQITGGQLFSTSVDITGSGISDRVEFFRLLNLINKTP